jgi:cell division protein FtsB
MRGIKSKGRGKWKRALAFVLLMLVFGVLLNSVRKVYEKKEEAERTLAKMDEEMFQLRKREEFLKDSIEKIATSEGIEFELRKKLNVARAGESVAIIVEEEPTTDSRSDNISAWQKIKNFFGKLFE